MSASEGAVRTAVPRRVTMADVAALAGVSTATVSRVINGSRPVDPALREAVTDAASSLGYRVNLVGRALRKGRTATVGLLVPDLDNPFFSSLAQHLSTAFKESEIDVLISTAGEDLALERRGVESFLGRQVDAILIIPCHEVRSARAVQRAAHATVTVQLDRRVEGADVHFIGCDNAAAMRDVQAHIASEVDQLDQPVVYVGARGDSSTGHERHRCFAAAYPGSPAYLGTFDMGWGQRAVDQILADGFRRGTIVTAADIIALGVIARLHSKGFAVPGDFRVIGFDGVGVARLAVPSLTTVRQPVEAMGRTVFDLVAAADTAQPAVTVRLAPQLVIGKTSPIRAAVPR